MLILIAATMAAMAVTFYYLKMQKSDPNQLSQPRGSIITVGVQIICGDCSGDAEIPLKTYLDRFGTCASCGGHSYELASNRAIYAYQLRAARINQFATETNRGRVIPFEAPLRAAHTDKIAV